VKYSLMFQYYFTLLLRTGSRALNTKHRLPLSPDQPIPPLDLASLTGFSA